MSELENVDFIKEITTISAEDMELAQVIYKKITEKTEKTIKRYSKKYVINLDSIKQVYNKLCQITHSWTTLGPNCDVSITYADDTTEKFSSAEKFFMFDQSKASPVMEIALKFSFLHQSVVSETEKPYQPYSVTIRILNANSVIEKEDIPPSVFKRIFGPCIMAEFEYVDYMIVKSLISTVDSWVEYLEEVNNPRILDYFKSKYDYGGKIFTLLFFILSCCFVLFKQLQVNFGNIKNTFVIIALIIVICSFVGLFVGNKIENIIDNLLINSKISFTNGDNKLISKIEKKYKKNLWLLFLSFVGSIGYNVLIGFICSFLDKLIK